MITKSPMSMWGAKVGLCLPRRRLAVWTARRPRTTSVASMTSHSRWMSAGLGLYVRTAMSRSRSLVPILGRGAGGGAAASDEHGPDRSLLRRDDVRICTRSGPPWGGSGRGRSRDQQEYGARARAVKTADRRRHPHRLAARREGDRTSVAGRVEPVVVPPRVTGGQRPHTSAALPHEDALV